jgi:hypothetical protein
LAQNITRRSALKSFGVTGATAFAVTAGIATACEQHSNPSSASSQAQTYPAYSVKNFGGKSANGLYDDQSVQRCLTAAAAHGSGTIVIDTIVTVNRAILLPAKGNYLIVSSGAPVSVYYLGSPSFPPASGVVVTGRIGDQPREGSEAGTQFVFDCSAATAHGSQGELTLGLMGITFYNLTSHITAAVYLTNHVYNFDCNWCSFQNCALAFGGTAGGASQVLRINISHCQGSNGYGLWCPHWGPFGGDISGNVWGEANDDQMPTGCLGSFLHAGTFWSWNVHDNFFFGQVSKGTLARYWIYAANISQTIDGCCHDNTYYGASHGCIYWNDNYGANVSNASAGVHIHDEEFCDWNRSGISGSAGSAVKIDHSKASTPDQMIVIGKCIWSGGRRSLRGLEVVDNPDAAAVVFDREQIMRHITMSPYRLEGVDYGSPGTSHRFQGRIATPPVPRSGSPLVNPFGFDCTIYASGGAVTAISINGTPTGLILGMFRLPRDASITLTYSSAPTWQWFAD